MIPDRIFLVGYLGSAKKAVAEQLAAKLDRPLFDTEEIVAASIRHVPGEPPRRESEVGLRQRERRALVSVATGPPAVIVTGPNVFLDRGNQRTIANAGVSVHIDATLEECLAEAVERGVISLDDEEQSERFAAQYEQRREQYDKADLVVETDDRDAEALADEILQRLEDRLWEERMA